MFHCNSGECIAQEHVCDSIVHCADRSDELNCALFECAKGFIKCNSGNCIHKENWCNYRRDCPDGSDETHCG